MKKTTQSPKGTATPTPLTTEQLNTISGGRRGGSILISVLVDLP